MQWKECIYFDTDTLYLGSKPINAEQRQTITEYNEELEAADRRIEAGKFIKAEDLKKKSTNW